MELQNEKEIKIENKEITKETTNNNEKEEEKIDYKNYPLEEEDELNKDINDIVDYLKDLDYEKYAHDMEIREALELLKSKMLKDEEEKKKNETKIITIEDNNNKNKNISNEEKIEEKKEEKKEEKEEKEEIKKVIKEKPIIDIEKEKKKDEIRKYRVAESIAKTDKMKTVHSIQSVRKLIQSQGLDGNIDPLRITVIKENPLIRDDDYVPNKLPFLHSLPLV